MPVKTTVLRLERQIREEHLRGHQAARLEWERLAGEVVAAGRRRGWAGDDPYLALQALCADDPQLRRLALAVGELWLTFFGCLDPSGGGAEVRSFRAAADALNKRLAKAAPGEGPDPLLAAEVLETLDGFWKLRQRQLDERIEALARAGSAQANAALAQTVEQERARREAAEAESRGTVAAFGAFLSAIGAAAEGRDTTPLPGRAQTMVDAVRRLGESRAELQEQVQELRAQVAQIASERRELLDQLKASETELAARRSALAAVIETDEPAVEATVRACDRHLAGLAGHLTELRAIIELGGDPKRLRPRLFGGDYDFRTLPGQAEALRDAARDLLAFADRLRWAQGVKALARAAPKLEAVFEELVRLVAAWRARLGDPPPMSATMAIRSSESLLALPAVVAADVESLLRKRGAGERAAGELAAVLEPCAALLHRVVGETRGDAPPRLEAPKREGAKAAAARLAGELSDLAGRLESAFQEAVATGFKLPAPEARLVADEQLVRLGLQQLDGACVELAALPGAPAGDLAALPARGDAEAALRAARTRADWLEVLAACRFVVR
jgi:hypothetical protein